jgi:hypothetical protein
MEQDQNTRPPAPDTHVDARDFRVISVSIVASDGTQQEVAPSVAEVQVRQDMFLSFMSGELLITDGNDLVSRLGLHGGEYMFLHFEVPEQDIVLKKAFRIYKIVDRNPKDAQQKFKILFVSDELYNSHSIKVSKAYTNTTISEIALDLLKNVLKIPENRIFIDKTTGSTSVIVPYWNPVETLNWLAARAYAPGSSTYFFYEDVEGFHFASTAGIYKRGTKIKVPFSLENKRGEKELDMDKFAIDDYIQKKEFDILSCLQDGGYAMGLTKLDLITRTRTAHEYNLGTLPKAYTNPIMSNQKDLYRKTDAHRMTYIAQDGIENWISHVMANAVLNSNLAEITVPGNMGLLIGTMLNVRVPYIVTPAEGDMWDKRKSGKYLVTAVNHKFDLVQSKFTSLVWLTRDSLPEPLPNVDKTLPDKIARLNK